MENYQPAFQALFEIDLRAIDEGTELSFAHSRLHDENTRRSHAAERTEALERHFPTLKGDHHDHA